MEYTCDQCGGRFQFDGSGGSNHLTSEGEIDYDEDRHHVPYMTDDDGEPICEEDIEPSWPDSVDGEFTCPDDMREVLSKPAQ